MNELDAVRAGDWKLHFRKGGKPFRALYNLSEDVGETKDVCDENPDVARSLEELADKFREDIGDSSAGIEGKNCRSLGRVKDPKPLTEYDPRHPYIIAMYDVPYAG